MGNLVAEKPQACAATDRLADRVHIHPESPEGE